MSAHETTLKFQYHLWVNTSSSVFSQITYHNCWLLKWFVMPLSLKCTCGIASTHCMQTEKCCMILLSVSPTKFCQVYELSVGPWTRVKQNSNTFHTCKSIYLEHLVPLPILDINILSILHYKSSWLMHVDFWPHEQLIYL